LQGSRVITESISQLLARGSPCGMLLDLTFEFAKAHRTCPHRTEDWDCPSSLEETENSRNTFCARDIQVFLP
jgi:hypothetical protein